jgi:hypothetical protein
MDWRPEETGADGAKDKPNQQIPLSLIPDLKKDL